MQAPNVTVYQGNKTQVDVRQTLREFSWRELLEEAEGNVNPLILPTTLCLYLCLLALLEEPGT